MVQVDSGDVDIYAEMFKLAKAAGWVVKTMKVLEGPRFEVRLDAAPGSGTFGVWSGSLAEFRKLCSLTTPPNAG
jgi:hypothetical protein